MRSYEITSGSSTSRTLLPLFDLVSTYASQHGRLDGSAGNVWYFKQRCRRQPPRDPKSSLHRQWCSNIPRLVPGVANVMAEAEMAYRKA